MRRVLLAVGGLLFVATASVGAAQQRREGASYRAERSILTAELSAPTRLPALVATGVPRGLVTVIVPIPVSLLDAHEVTFEVRSSGEMEVIGRMVGVFSTAAGQPRPLVLTMRIPAEARAGSMGAAEVLFRASDGRELLVPILVDVALVREVTLTGPREIRNLRNGDRVELAYRVFNAGNGPDTLLVDVQGPAGWVAKSQPSGVIVLPARRAQEIVVRVNVPPTSSIGDYSAQIFLRDIGTREAVATMFTTLGLTGRGGSAAGLILRSTLAGTTTSSGSAQFTGFALEGPVAPGVYLRTQLNGSLRGGGLPVQGLSSVGASNSPFSLSVSGETWDVSVGNTGTPLSDLTGVSVAGTGLTATLANERWRGGLIGARPTLGRDADGVLAGGVVARATAVGEFGASVSSLREDGGVSFGRQLQAVGVQYQSLTTGANSFQSAVAHRSFADGSGVGYQMGVSHRGDATQAAVRFAHAPGGSAAFARATEEWQLDVARTVTRRLSVDGAYTASRDAGNVFSASEVGQWSVGGRFIVSSDLVGRLRVMDSRFDVEAAVSTIGGFGARDRSIEAGVDWRLGKTSLALDGEAGVVTRSTQLSEAVSNVATAQQRSLRATVLHPTDRFGSFDGTAAADFTEAGVGVPGQQFTLSGRWSSLPFSIAERQVRLNADVTYQQLGSLQRAVISRATARIALPAGLDLALSAEHNPFFRNADGSAGWIAAMRVTASTKVFTPRTVGPPGVVFEDRNQNGRRDDGEPGVAGVMVRRGEARVRSDRGGVYRLPLSARGRTTIDQSSLPIGLLAHPMLAADVVERLDIPVLPTGRIVIELALVADEEGRTPAVSLEPTVVILRDATGFEWVGRKTTATTAEFDGIPVGRYELQFNTTRLSEPLRVPNGQVVDVDATRNQQIRAEFRGRMVRRFVPGRTSGGGAR